MLDRSATEQLLAHLATDLSGLLPGLQRYSLAMAGALFDQTQVLRPAFPILDGLARIEQANRGDRGRRRGLLAIGAVEGAFPVPELQPDPSLPPGILHLLLLQLTGDGQEIDALADEAEHRCMEEGQLSPQSARALEAAFKLPVAHARFMTLTDLEAMLRLQLEHFGFLPLWELVDAALHGGGALEVASRVVLSDKTTIDGPRFSWDGKGVTASFETFDHWANLGQGRELPAERLEEAYGHWLRHYRQFLVTLDAHAVPVTQRLAADESRDNTAPVLDGVHGVGQDQ